MHVDEVGCLGRGSCASFMRPSLITVRLRRYGCDAMPRACRRDVTYSYLGPAGTFTEAALGAGPRGRGKTVARREQRGRGPRRRRLRSQRRRDDRHRELGRGRRLRHPGRPRERPEPAHHRRVPRAGELRARRPARHDARRCRRSSTRIRSPTRSATLWLDAHLPRHGHIPATSQRRGRGLPLRERPRGCRHRARPGSTKHHDLDVLAENIGDNPNAVTRFVLGQPHARAAGANRRRQDEPRSSELPDDRSGALLEMLEQFATRGVNMSLLQSRPIGDALGRYRFVIDARRPHPRRARRRRPARPQALLSPNVIFLGCYPRADKQADRVHLPLRRRGLTSRRATGCAACSPASRAVPRRLTARPPRGPSARAPDPLRENALVRVLTPSSTTHECVFAGIRRRGFVEGARGHAHEQRAGVGPHEDRARHRRTRRRRAGTPAGSP